MTTEASLPYSTNAPYPTIPTVPAVVDGSAPYEYAEIKRKPAGMPKSLSTGSFKGQLEGGVKMSLPDDSTAVDNSGKK